MNETCRIIDFRFAPDRPQSCIGLVDDTFKTIVREDGSINFGYNGRKDIGYYTFQNNVLAPVLSRDVLNHGFHFRYRPAISFRDELLEIKQDFVDPEVAHVDTHYLFKSSRLDLSEFAHKMENGCRVDVVLWKLTAGDTFTPVRATVHLQELGEVCDGSFTIVNVPEVKTRAIEHDRPHLFAAGEVKEGAFLFVHEGKLDEVPALEQIKLMQARSKAYWKSVKPFQKTFRIPDPQIMEMLASCGRNILQAREYKKGIPTFQVGPTKYRGLWFADGYFILEAAHIMNRHDEAYRGLDAVIACAHEDGSIEIMPHHDKETGLALSIIIRQCELMEDDDRIRELWPTMRKALVYIRKQREQARALGDDYVGYGLFPPSLGDGGINIEPELTTPLWVLHGLKDAWRVGKRLQLNGFEDFKAEYDDLMQAFLKVVQKNMRTENGIPYLPMSLVPEAEVKERVIKQIANLNCEFYSPLTGIWSYDQAIYPGEVFDENDPLVTNLLAMMDAKDDAEGLPINTGWMGNLALWPYGGMFDALVWLYADRGDKTADYLYAFANHAAPARVWREEQSLKGTNSNEMTGDMPHNWGSAMFIFVTRTMIVMEKKDSLYLLSGMPNEWLPDKDNPLVLEDTPTRYGNVTLTMEQDSKDIYTLSYRHSGMRKPTRICIKWGGRIEGDVTMDSDGNWTVIGVPDAFTLRLFRR